MTKTTAKTRVAASLLLQTFILLSLAFASQPVSAAGFSVTPSDPTQRLFNLEVKPGEKKDASVEIENVSDSPITVSVYGADGTQSNQGTFALTTKSSEQRHIGLWTKVAEDTVTIEARQRKEVGFTVSVPADATPGTYSGGIAVEEGNSGKNALAPANGGNAISISARIVVKLFVTVPGEKINSYEWTGFTFTPAYDATPGTFNLSYKNTGNTIITVTQDITVKGFPGKEESFKLPTATLLQGSTVDIPVKWDKEPFFGFYTATATVVFSEYDITSNTSVNGKSETKDISVYVPLKLDTNEGKLTVAVAAVLLILLILLVISFILKMSFRRKCVPYDVVQGETITSIAEKCKVNWKKLAKVNRLKPPYTLKAGQKIIAPPQPAQTK